MKTIDWPTLPTPSFGHLDQSQYPDMNYCAPLMDANLRQGRQVVIITEWKGRE